MSTPEPHRPAAQTQGAMKIEECDIPDGMTLGEWRAANAAERRAERADRPSLRQRLLQRRRGA